MFSIQQQTGWTDDYILWGISHANLRMKAADALRYKDNKVKDIDDWNEVTFKCE